MYTITHVPATGTPLSQHADIEVTMTENPRPKIHEQVKSPSEIEFGKHFADHMLLCHWDKVTGWEKPKIVPYGDLPMSPASSVLHYSTEVGLSTTVYVLQCTCLITHVRCIV